jgi:hypothetical protein
MNKRTISSILVLNLLVGCATPHITPIRRGEEVAIVFTKSPQDDGVIDSRNEKLVSNTATGAGTGAAGGAVTGGLTSLLCGPFVLLCLPFFVTAGVIIGTPVGAGVGAVVAVRGSLSDEKAAQLRDRLMSVQQSHSLPAELQKNVNDRAQRYWKLSTDPSATLVTIELQNLLLSNRDEQISFTVQVKVSVQQHGAKQADPPEQKMYEYVSTLSSLSVWLDESSDFVDIQLTSASQQIAANIVSDLAQN